MEEISFAPGCQTMAVASAGVFHPFSGTRDDRLFLHLSVESTETFRAVDLHGRSS